MYLRTVVRACLFLASKTREKKINEYQKDGEKIIKEVSFGEEMTLAEESLNNTWQIPVFNPAEVGD